jgi:osmotically inducible protein OsmC
MATRTGSAEWRGDLQGGSGRLTVGNGAWEGDYSFASRFEEGEGTNPEELIAAAEASCFAMALSNILAEHGHAPESVNSTARVQLRNVDGQPTIARIDLDVQGRVPDIDEAHFQEHAQEAKAGCPVSRALAGGPEIGLNASLA